MKLDEQLIFWDVIGKVKVLDYFTIEGLSTSRMEAKVVIEKNLVLLRSNDKLREELGGLVSSEEMSRELG